VPEADNPLPFHLERFLCACGGMDAAEKYRKACEHSSAYIPEESLLEEIRTGLFVSVVSSSRLESAIPNVLNTHNYLLTPASALAYSGLLDYRAKTGINRNAVVICDHSPIHCKEIISDVLGISAEEVKKMI
jgi:threonine synthase